MRLPWGLGCMQHSKKYLLMVTMVALTAKVVLQNFSLMRPIMLAKKLRSFLGALELLI
jgi:hypothetical protein